MSERQKPDYVQQARLLGDARQWQRAADSARMALSQEPDNSDAHALLAISLAHISTTPQDLSEAETEARKAIACAPDYVFTYYSLGYVQHQQKDWPSAESTWKVALEIDPRWEEIYEWLSICLLNQERHEEANSAALKALEIAPESESAHLQAGRSYLCWGGHRDEAKSHYEAALRINPQSADALYNLAIIESLNGDLDKGDELAREALSINPTYSRGDDHLRHNRLRRSPFLKAFYWWDRFSAEYHGDSKKHYPTKVVALLYFLALFSRLTHFLSPASVFLLSFAFTGACVFHAYLLISDEIVDVYLKETQAPIRRMQRAVSIVCLLALPLHIFSLSR